MSQVVSLDPLTLLVKYGLVDRGDGTIFDTRTKLLWQQSHSYKPYNWEDAHKYCKRLHLAGYKDWRLPTIEELKTLIEKEHRPTICPIFNCKSSYYWSSSTYEVFPVYAWFVNFDFGHVYSDGLKSHGYYVFAVHSGP